MAEVRLEVVLEFLRKNGFEKSEVALKSELERKGKKLEVEEVEADLYPWNFSPTYEMYFGNESSGENRTVRTSLLSVSQGNDEDTLKLVTGAVTFVDGSDDYPNAYWDSDEYDDDDDVGYRRQPIEDETWFLAHEIDYPIENEKGTGHFSVPDLNNYTSPKYDVDSHSLSEEDFSGEQYCEANNIEQVVGSDATEKYGGTYKNQQNLIISEPAWKGFPSESNELIMFENGEVLNDYEKTLSNNFHINSNQPSSANSIGVCINGHAACLLRVNNKDRGFSFPTTLRDGDREDAESGKFLSSNKHNTDLYPIEISANDMLAIWSQKSSDFSSVESSRDESSAYVLGSKKSSVAVSDSDYPKRDTTETGQYYKASSDREVHTRATLEDKDVAAVQEQFMQIKAQEEEFETFDLKIVQRKNRTGFEEDKKFHVVLNSVIAGRYLVTEYLGSAALGKAIQAHDLQTGMDVCIKVIKNNKDFFDQSLDEIKLLKYVNKNDPADKYHVLRLYDYFYFRDSISSGKSILLGEVIERLITNTATYFFQNCRNLPLISEHLLIVCELLKANLYEFYKFNRESGGEVYFTMPRLQLITIQCLEALQFLHGIGLIHCDLKPENILVKSYSRCQVKVIDLGSSCFETDHLSSYVQSRSYRAPEVILGLPYDKNIDIWSLGCILAELSSGNVLFQNDSTATLLARVVGIIGPIDQNILDRGQYTHKYFSKNHTLYERNQETNRLEYLIPKKTSLRHRLPMGDQGFLDFVAHLLEVNPMKRPSALEALKHPWLSYPYERISS